MPWVKVAAGVAALAALALSRTVAVPLFTAVLLALALSPLCHQLCRAHVPRGIAALLAVIILLTALGMSIYLVRQPLSRLLARGPDILRVAHRQALDITDGQKTDGQKRPPVNNARTQTDDQQAVLTMLTPVAAVVSPAHCWL